MQETNRKSILARNSTIKIVQAPHSDMQGTIFGGHNSGNQVDWRNQSTVQASSEREDEESAT